MYFPLDPYKSMLQILRSKENLKGLPAIPFHSEMGYEQSIPLNFDNVPFVRLGSSTGVGLRYLAKLLSGASIRPLHNILLTLNDALGKLDRL